MADLGRSVRAVVAMLLASVLLLPAAAAFTPPAWSDHDPIVINGNQDFTSANGVNGGSGTPEDPFLIQGWRIEARGPALCDLGQEALPAGIVIRNTTASFVVSALVQAADGRGVGICIEGARDATVRDSEVSGHRFGVRIVDTEQTTVQSTQADNNTAWGLWFDRVAEVTVANSQASGNSGMGLYLCNTGTSMVESSTFANNGQHGADLTNSSTTIFSNNRFVANADSGIAIITAGSVGVQDNTFEDHQGAGVRNVGGDYVFGFGNAFLDNQNDILGEFTEAGPSQGPDGDSSSRSGGWDRSWPWLVALAAVGVLLVALRVGRR